CIGSDAPNINDARNGESVNWLRITNRMAADYRASHFGCLGKTAAQNGRNYSRSDEIGRKTDDVQSGQRAASHRENVRERVGRGDLSIGKWVIHDWRKEIDCLHESATMIQSIYTGIIKSVRAYDDVPVDRKGKLRQNLSQGLLAQFRCSPGGGRQRRQFSDLLTRHP